MSLTKKLKHHGIQWTMRRSVRELIRPTTPLGQYFKPLSHLFYRLVSQPINFIQTRKRQNTLSQETLYFFYDFDVEPITYDFVWALCVANATRESLGLTFLHVVFVPGTVDGLRQEQPAYDDIIDHDMRMWRIDSMLLPCVQLLPCQYSMTRCATREEARAIREQQAQFVYPTQYNVTFPIPYAPEQAMVYRQQMLSLRAVPQAKTYVQAWLQRHAKNKKVIVITLRQYAYTPERNSNLKAWARFAHQLDQQQFFVVFVPDTEQALQAMPKELETFAFFDPACWNVHLRVALYELADLNLGVNTGPMSLCWFNARCRYITFKTAVKNVAHVPLEMITDKGFVQGCNPVFAREFQQWIWEDDDFEVIDRVFKEIYQTLS